MAEVPPGHDHALNLRPARWLARRSGSAPMTACTGVSSGRATAPPPGPGCCSIWSQAGIIEPDRVDRYQPVRLFRRDQRPGEPRPVEGTPRGRSTPNANRRPDADRDRHAIVNAHGLPITNAHGHADRDPDGDGDHDAYAEPHAADRHQYGDSRRWVIMVKYVLRPVRYAAAAW